MASEKLNRRAAQRNTPVQRQVIHMVREEHRHHRTPAEDVEGNAAAIGHCRELNGRRPSARNCKRAEVIERRHSIGQAPANVTAADNCVNRGCAEARATPEQAGSSKERP